MTTPTTKKKPRGARIPRLQEISFLNVAMLGVADGANFEEIRQRLIDHMIEMRENSDATGNTATFRTAKNDPKRYVTNASQSLKELMGLGLVEKATVPSSARAALNYATTTFLPTPKGKGWAQLLRDDLKSAYDELLDMLWQAHPQFAAFVDAIAAPGLVIPILPWSQLREPRTRINYVRSLVSWVVQCIGDEQSGWTASKPEVREAVGEYLNARYESARARGRDEPYPKNRDFVNACEEALVKFAFARRGVSIDYISHEILRRWTKELGVANFSYHVPGAIALRLWSTAEMGESSGRITASRRAGPAIIQSAIDQLPNAYEEARRQDQQRSLWVPIYRVRADVCWNLKTTDSVFDRALHQVLAGDSNEDIPFGINLEVAQYGNVPPSELPLRLPTRRGLRTYYAMSLIPRRMSRSTTQQR